MSQRQYHHNGESSSTSNNNNSRTLNQQQQENFHHDDNTEMNNNNRDCPRFIDAFLPPFCAQFSIINEMPPLTVKEQPIFKNMDQSKDLYTYNLLQCPHHKEEVMKWLGNNDKNLVEGLYNVLTSKPRMDDEIILNSNGGSLVQQDLTTLKNSSLLNSLLKFQEDKENKPINPLPVSYDLYKKSLQKETPKVTSNTTPIKIRKARRNKKLIDEVTTTTTTTQEKPLLPNQSLKPVINAKLAPKTTSIEKLVGALDELFAWSDFRQNEDELVEEHLLKDVEVEIGLAHKNNYLKEVATEKYIKLLTVLESQIKVGLELVKAVSGTDGEELVSSLKQDKESINKASRSAILSFTVMSGRGVSKETLNEECFETILDFTKTLLRKYVYPIVESVGPKKKGSKKHSCNSELIQLCKIFKKLDKILRKQSLKDEFVLTISDIAVSTFFVNGIDDIQLASLGVITKIFSSFPDHREQILGEITVSLLRLPANKKTDRRFRVPESSIHIQMFTSLMLQLIHSCTFIKRNDSSVVARKLIFDDDTENPNSEDDQDDIMKDSTPESEDIIITTYEQAVRCATTFSEYFLERCTKSESVDGDNRLIIEHFVEDLLSVLPLPSWPAADLLLQALANVLCNKYLSQKDIADKYRQLALKILGKLAARIKDLEFKNLEFMKDYMLTMECIQDKNGVAKNNGVDMTPTTTKLHDEFKNLFELDEMDKMKISLFTYLSMQQKDYPMISFSKQFIISQWFYDEREIEKKAPFYNNLLMRGEANILNSSSIKSDTDSQNLYINILCNRNSSIINKFDFIFGQIISELKDDKPKVRADAIKALQTVINMDSSVLMKNYVQLGIRERTVDAFPSVRESVIDLIGNAMITLKRYEDFYIRIILDRVKDTSKSVRKKSISILGELCSLITEDNMITEICKTLASRLSHQNKEEDNIKELVLKTFTKLWFDKNTTEKFKLSGLQIVDVIGKQAIDFKQYKDHWLYQIINLASTSKDHEKIQTSLKMIIETLIQHVIKLDSEEKKGVSSFEIFNRFNIVTCMSALHLICLADHTLFLSHFRNISVYIKSENQLALVFHAVCIVDKLSPYINKPDQKFCDLLQKELVKLIFSSPGVKQEMIEACVGCLCNFCSRIKNTQYLYTVLNNIFSYISVCDTNLQSEQRTCRLLYAAALFCRYQDFDSMTDLENITNPNLKPGKVVQTIYSITIGWICKSSELIKQKAARSLGFLLIRQPKLFLVKNTQTAISQSLASENKDFVYEIVLMFKDFLLAEESKLSSANSHQENVDAGVTSTLMLSYIDALISLLDDTTDCIRHATLEVLELTVQQGLTIPSKIMKYTLAMESDPNSEVREKAHTINLYLYDRFAKMFISESRHSFSKAFTHLNKLTDSESSLVKGTIDGKSAFSGIYSFVSEFGPETKKGILCDFIRTVFNSMESSNIENMLLWKEVSFMIEALTHLPYKNLFEVAEIVNTLGEKLDMLGDSVKDELKMQIKKDVKDLKLIRKYITLSCCLCLLIQFKNTLQMRYNLNNSKMEEYSADPKSFIKKFITSSSVRDVFLVEFNQTPKIVKVISKTNQEYEEETIMELYQWSKKIIKSHMHDGFNVAVGKPKRQARKKVATSKKTTKKKAAPKKRKKTEEEEEYSGEESEEESEEEVEETSHENASSDEEEVEPIQTRKRTKRK